MLTNPSKLGERFATEPACAWFREQLWIAYGALNGELIVRSVDVRQDASVTVRHATGFSAGQTAAVTVWRDRLYILFGTGGEGGYQLTSTMDGSSFEAPIFVPIDGFTGNAGLTAHKDGLALLWAEIAGGRAHLLQSGNGTSFHDSALWFNIFPAAGITASSKVGELLIAFAERQGGPDSFTIATFGPAAPTGFFQTITTPTPERAHGIALCTTQYHNDPGVHVAVRDSSSHAYQGRTALQDLNSVGGSESFGLGAIDLSLAFDGKRAWVVWRGVDDELMVAPYMNAFELPEELLALLGEPCDEEMCPIDPRLVCAAMDEQVWKPVPARIHNAKRGDLVLTPGDGAGIVGTLLDQLEPRQFYDHMGIMVRDHDLIRHATMAHDRIRRKDPGRFMSGTFFGRKAPIDGFRWDALKFGWPGTITQSVEDGFYDGFNTINPATGQPFNKQGDFFALNPSVLPLPRPPDDATDEDWNAWRRQQRFADPEFPTDEPYGITNLPNGPAYRLDTGQLIDPVVVKPAPALEANDPRIRPLLSRIARSAEQIDGHYRFFCYSDARIALNPDMFGPPAGDAIWEGKPPGAAWSAGTRPVVCSSFVWAAVQLSNVSLPPIELEGSVTESPHELLASPTVDGLYRYLTDEREAAAHALHSLMEEKVKKEVYQSLQELEHEHQLIIDLTRIGIAALLALLAGPVAAAAVFLGVTPGTITDLKLLLEDMPDDVATQFCNTFASDRAEETDDDLWETPGEGIAVSPDDIKEFWDAPDPSSSLRFWHGLYRTTERLLLTPRRYELRRVHRWDRSPGPAYVEGMVTYAGEPIEGAEVRFGCEKTMTSRIKGRLPSFQLELSAGRYEVLATTYWPSTTELLTGKRIVDVRPGDQPGPIIIELEDPPEWRRLVQCTGRIDLVRKVLLGEDDWAHSAINLQRHMVKAPTDFGPPPRGASISTETGVVISDFAQRFNVRVDIELELQEDLSIVVKARSALCEHYYDHKRPPNGDEIVTSKQAEPVTIPPGGSATMTFDHDSGNVPPDRGHIEFKLENLRAPA